MGKVHYHKVVIGNDFHIIYHLDILIISRGHRICEIGEIMNFVSHHIEIGNKMVNSDIMVIDI